MIRQTVLVWFVIGWLSGLPAAASRAADEKPDELVQMILKLLGDEDSEFRAAGLDQVRSGAKGEAATKAVCGPVAQARRIGPGGAAQRAWQTAAMLLRVRPCSNCSAPAATTASVRRPSPRSASWVRRPICRCSIKSLSAKSDAEQSAARSSLARIRGKTVSTTLAAGNRQSRAGRESRPHRGARHAAGQGRHARLRGGDRRRQRASPQCRHGGPRADRPSRANCRNVAGRAQGRERGERDAAERNVALVCSRIENEDIARQGGDQGAEERR